MENKKEKLLNFLQEEYTAASQLASKIDSLMEYVTDLSAPAPIIAATEPTPADIYSLFESLPLEEKVKFYSHFFSMGNMGESIDNKLILISLIGSFYIAIKAKTPTITVMEAVNKIIDDTSLQGTPEMKKAYKEKIAILVEDSVYGVTKGNTFGLKNAVELKAKVNEIVQFYVPF